VRILTEPDASLTTQYKALMATEGVQVEFAPDGVRRIAEIAFQVNERTENIGARRLHTVMEAPARDRLLRGGGAERQADGQGSVDHRRESTSMITWGSWSRTRT